MRANAVHMDQHPDAQQLFADQVREIQERYPRAHALLLNWAKWSRETRGIFPRVEVWSGWSMGLPIEEWGAAGAHGVEDTTRRKRSEPLKDVKPDPVDEGQSLERQAIELDIVLTCSDFPSVWRQVVKAAYCYKRVPLEEHAYPQEAGITNPDDFLAMFEACLEYLEIGDLTPQAALAHFTG